MQDIKTSELISHLLKVGEWNKAPAHVIKVVTSLDEEYGGNIAIGRHPKLGLFVLHDQGFGIGLVWKEKEDNNELELPSLQDSIQCEVNKK